MKDHVTLQNCVLYYILAMDYKFRFIERAAFSLIASNLPEIVISKQMRHIGENTLLRLLGENSFPWSEELKVKAINTWLTNNTNFEAIHKFTSFVNWRCVSLQKWKSLIPGAHAVMTQWIDEQLSLLHSSDASQDESESESDIYNDSLVNAIAGFEEDGLNDASQTEVPPNAKKNGSRNRANAKRAAGRCKNKKQTSPESKKAPDEASTTASIENNEV